MLRSKLVYVLVPRKVYLRAGRKGESSVEPDLNAGSRNFVIWHRQCWRSMEREGERPK
jgi:hypothetical protein